MSAHSPLSAWQAPCQHPPTCTSCEAVRFQGLCHGPKTAVSSLKPIPGVLVVGCKILGFSLLEKMS